MDAVPERPALPPPPSAPPPPRRGRAAAIAATLIAATALAATLAWHGLSTPPPEPAPALIPRPPAVVGLGWIEPASTILRIAAPGNPDASRIAALAVEEGERVAAGQLLATLDTASRQAAQVAQAEAQVDLRRTLLARAAADHTHLLAARTASMARAQSGLRLAEAEHARQQALVAASAASRAAFDRAAHDLAHAAATLQEAQAALARTQATQQGAPIDIAVATAELATAQADLAAARAAHDQAHIRAPIAGVVLALRARPGERIGADGLLDLGDTRRMRAVIEVCQTDIARIRPGQAVALRADALDAPLAGTVDRLGHAVRRQTVINADPATATDARVVEVQVTLPPEAGARTARLSRLQVTATFAP
jgi:HlyD family secretion protein